MRVNRAYLKEIKYCHIVKLEITQKVNEHSFAKISGIIPQDKVDECLNLVKKDSYISLIGIVENGKTDTMFVGKVYSLKIQNDGNVNLLEITLVSGTILMDGNEYTKTFQDASMSYCAIYKNIEKEQAANSLMFCEDTSIEKMIVQYKETNWQFAKRLASNLGTCIYPYVLQEGVKYCIGVGENGKINTINNIQVSVKQSINKYMTDNETESIDSISDCISYEFDSREYFPIGSKISIDESKDSLYVYELHTELIKSEIITSYILKGKGGFARPRKYNNRIIGASLGGNIKSVLTDKVRINVDVDSETENTDCGSKEFLYSTVYSSPDGTGWYCMPENGDEIRVYFPTDKEEDGYVISSVHLDVDSTINNSQASQSGASGQMAPRSNPDYKSISNKQNKEIIFAPDKLTITNNNGLSIVLDDKEGITIDSDKGIYFKSDTMVQLVSDGDLHVVAKDMVRLTQDDKNTITMKEEKISIDGATLKLQGRGQ